MKKSLKKKVDKINSIFFLVGSGIIGIVLIILVIVLLQDALNVIFGEQTSLNLVIFLMAVFILITINIYVYEGLKRNKKIYKKIKPKIKKRAWFIIWAEIFIILFVICCLIIPNYPGERDLDRSYFPWYINNGYFEEAKLINCSPVEIDSSYGKKYFVENDRIEIYFDYQIDEQYNIPSFDILDSENNRISSGLCEKEFCEAKFKISNSIEEMRIIPKLINKENYSEILSPIIITFNPEILSESEAKNRERDRNLFIGSLLSILLLTSAAFVNQIKHLWKNED